MVGFTYDDFAFGHNHICFNFHEQNQIIFFVRFQLSGLCPTDANCTSIEKFGCLCFIEVIFDFSHYDGFDRFTAKRNVAQCF